MRVSAAIAGLLLLMGCKVATQTDLRFDAGPMTRARAVTMRVEVRDRRGDLVFMVDRPLVGPGALPWPSTLPLEPKRTWGASACIDPWCRGSEWRSISSSARCLERRTDASAPLRDGPREQLDACYRRALALHPPSLLLDDGARVIAAIGAIGAESVRRTRTRRVGKSTHPEVYCG